jgi:hypothetical protein
LIELGKLASKAGILLRPLLPQYLLPPGKMLPIKLPAMFILFFGMMKKLA